VIEEPLVDLAGFIVKDAGSYHTGTPRPIQYSNMMESLSQTLTLPIPSTFPDPASNRGSVIGVRRSIFSSI
jgi:hypothetical protein